jgi:hypothetical protein
LKNFEEWRDGLMKIRSDEAEKTLSRCFITPTLVDWLLEDLWIESEQDEYYKDLKDH